MHEKILKPSTLILVGLFYFIWPFDFPTFIDDIIVNALCISGAFYLKYGVNKVCNKLEGVTKNDPECAEVECEKVKCEETEYEEVPCERNRIEFVKVFNEEESGE